MEISLILTALTKDWLDFGIILGMLVINAIIGYIEESRAESAIASLKNSLALKCRCWRNGQLTEVSSRDIVVGDIIVLRLGYLIQLILLKHQYLVIWRRRVQYHQV